MQQVSLREISGGQHHRSSLFAAEVTTLVRAIALRGLWVLLERAGTLVVAVAGRAFLVDLGCRVGFCERTTALCGLARLETV